MDPRNHHPSPRFALALLLLGALGCAGARTTVEALPGPGNEKRVAIEASSFAFAPDRILANRGDVLELQVQNRSGMAHNLTVKNPAGQVAAAVDLPGQGAATLRVALPEAGAYEFFCDKPLHPTLGMTGVIEAR
ncbi:MAG: plastocyanin/azurin family copper-binding protein [Deferrisomatales bacterium]